MQILHYEKLLIEKLKLQSQQISNTGQLAKTSNGYFYLKVDDAYIHTLQPLLKERYPLAHKPRYFGKEGVGAHISLIYPNEGTHFVGNNIGQEHSFIIKDCVRAIVKDKFYYVLLITSPTLIAFRKYYQLGEKLNFKGYAIDLHITFATEPLPRDFIS